MTIRDCRQWLKKDLKFSSVASLEGLIFLSYVFKKNKEWIYANQQANISPIRIQKLKELIKKRKQGFPVAYLIKEKEFFGLKFYVNSDVLIPRPETEKLVEEALKSLKRIEENKKNAKGIVVDLGTGSGCIMASIVKNFTCKTRINFVFWAIDKSLKALLVAKKNFKQLGIERKIKIKQGNLLIPLKRIRWKKNDSLLILANLPYVPQKDYLKLSSEVKKEPIMALTAQDNGLSLIKKTLQMLYQLKKRQPFLKIEAFFEMAPLQVRELQQFMKKLQEEKIYFKISFRKDLQGKNRFLKVY